MINENIIINNTDKNNNINNNNNNNVYKMKKKTNDSMLSISKPASRTNKYMTMNNINTNNMNINSNNNNDIKLKMNDNNIDTYSHTSLQSPCNNNKSNNNNINDDIPSIPLPLNNVTFQPSGSWIERKLSKKNNNQNNLTSSSSTSTTFYQNDTYHTLTSYVPSGLSILCHSTIKCIDIHCVGVSLLKIIYYKDTSLNENNTFNKVNEDNNNNNNDIKSKKGMITVNEISLPNIDMDDGDYYLPQRVSLSLPYPCLKVDILLLKRKLDFVSIMGIYAYAAASRSSSLSTPHK